MYEFTITLKNLSYNGQLMVVVPYSTIDLNTGLLYYTGFTIPSAEIAFKNIVDYIARFTLIMMKFYNR